MAHDGYFNRALKANDPRYARVFEKLGYSRSDMAGGDKPAIEPTKDDEKLAGLRDEYQRVVGKKPYHGWDAATLEAKIKAAKKND